MCIRCGNYKKHKAVRCPVNVSLTLVGVDVGVDVGVLEGVDVGVLEGVDVGVLEGVDDGVYMKRQLI